MKDWIKYDKQTIWNDKKKGGLLVSFLADYRDTFNIEVNASCGSCFNKYYTDYLNSLPMDETKFEKCDYELHKKYENITLKFSGKRIRNRDLTNELAKDLIANHPHGEKLFSVIAKKSTKKVKPIAKKKPTAKKKAVAKKTVTAKKTEKEK